MSKLQLIKQYIKTHKNLAITLEIVLSSILFGLAIMCVYTSMEFLISTKLFSIEQVSALSVFSLGMCFACFFFSGATGLMGSIQEEECDLEMLDSDIQKLGYKK